MNLAALSSGNSRGRATNFAVMRNHTSAASSVPSELNDPVTRQTVNIRGSENCSQDQNLAWDNVTAVVTARQARTQKKLRFREKLETKKCRDTQYRHIIVTIVTLPVGLSACDLLLLIGQLSAFSPSDWLMVSHSSSLVLVTLVTVFQVISHSVTAHQMSWEP